MSDDERTAIQPGKPLTTFPYKGDRFDDVLLVLEAHSGALRALSDRLDVVDAKVDKLDAKVDKLDAKVDRLDAKIDKLGDRHDAMHSSLAARLDRLLEGTGR